DSSRQPGGGSGARGNRRFHPVRRVDPARGPYSAVGLAPLPLKSFLQSAREIARACGGRPIGAAAVEIGTGTLRASARAEDRLRARGELMRRRDFLKTTAALAAQFPSAGDCVS